MKRMLINAADAEEARIAVVEDGVLQELHVEISSREAYLGNIYKAKVVNIEPSIGAAFVNFGGTTNGFLHASDVLPAYGRPDFDLKDIIEGRARVTGDEGPESIRAALDDDDDNDSASSGKSGSKSEVEDSNEPHGGADPGDEGGEEFGAELVEGSPGASSPAGNSAAGTAAEAVATEKVKKPRRGRVRRERQRIPIDQLLKKGQEVVVQITKEGIGAKGPALTTFISLPGRSLVMMPSLPKCGVSRKIDNPKERRRLKKIVKELDETGNGGVGFIVRTAGTEKTKTDLKRDRDYLKKIWDMVSQRMPQTRAPSLLYQESDLVLKAMRDLFSPEIEEVVCDSKDVFMRIKDFAEKLMPHMADRIRLHEPITPLFHSFGIEKDVESLFSPRVELANGGSIVIDQTEALVAIDVNSGRFKPGSNLEETAYKTNLDSIPEMVRQLRLRDLGGLIIIDFIDMTEERHRRSVERKMIEAMKGNKARIKVGKISPFGMLEITRQRVGPGLKHAVFSACSQCTGTGLVRTIPSKGLSVLREVRAVLHLKGFSILQVFVAPPVHDFLANRKRRQVLDLEESVGKTVFLRSEPSYPTDVVHYRFMTADGQEAKVAIPAGLGVKV